MKNVLVISYYFPPMGMGGVQRTLKFVKYLHKFGWKPCVLTDTPKVYFARDMGLLNDLTSGTFEIFRTKRIGSKNLLTGEKTFRVSNERMRKVLSVLGQSFLIPDTRRLWKNKAVSLGEEIINKFNIELIFATAPPYTDYLIGHELAERFKLPLVLDYRDLWVDCLNNVYVTPLHRMLNEKLERNILSASEKVVCINRRIKEILLEKYQVKDPDNIIVIPQGFDKEDFTNNGVANSSGTKMRITYAGSFLYYYTPEYFLKALSKVFEQKPELRNRIEACFVGTFPREYISMIEKYGLGYSVVLAGYLDHTDCIKYLMDSDVLWMMINKTRVSDMHSTGKLYEYFGTRKPILACVPDGVAKDSLKEYGAAKICGPDDVDSIARYIIEYYSLFEKNSLPAADSDIVDKYDREYLTKSLAEIFSSVVCDVDDKKGNKTENILAEKVQS